MTDPTPEQVQEAKMITCQAVPPTELDLLDAHDILIAALEAAEEEISQAKLAYSQRTHEAQDAINRAERAEEELLALTPGGSEFVGDPAACAQFARLKMDGAVKVIVTEKARAAAAEAYAAKLEKAGDAMAHRLSIVSPSRAAWDVVRRKPYVYNL